LTDPTSGFVSQSSALQSIHSGGGGGGVVPSNRSERLHHSGSRVERERKGRKSERNYFYPTWHEQRLFLFVCDTRIIFAENIDLYFINISGSEKDKPHIKKPLNAFMLYMKEMRPKIVAECTLKESAAINQILGRRVRKQFPAF